MRQTDTRKVAIAGIVVAAVLASCLILPAMGRLGTLDGTWLAAAILGLPTVAVLVATGYRYYGLGRSVAVAVVVVAITLVASGVFSVFVVASALGGSTTTMAMGVLLYGIPAVLVVVLGLLALKLVPPRSAVEHRLSTSAAGNRSA
jgi:hypothetical protein